MKKVFLVLGLFVSCAGTFQSVEQPVPEPVAYYGGIYGTVYDGEKSIPLENVEVKILGSDQSVATDKSGAFYFYDLSKDTITLSFIKEELDTIIVKNIFLEDHGVIALNAYLTGKKPKASRTSVQNSSRRSDSPPEKTLKEYRISDSGILYEVQPGSDKTTEKTSATGSVKKVTSSKSSKLKSTDEKLSPVSTSDKSSGETTKVKSPDKVTVKTETSTPSYTTSESGEPAVSIQSPPGLQSNYTVSNKETRTLYPTAGSHDDNEEYAFFLDYLGRYSFLKNVYHSDFEDRLIVQFTDSSGHPISHQPFKLVDWTNSPIWESTTYANGENVVYLHTVSPKSPLYRMKLEYTDHGIKKTVPLAQKADPLYSFQITPDSKDKETPLDLMFILDVTGSMDDELQQLKDTIYSIYHRILRSYPSLNVRIGAVCYRDHGDRKPTETVDFTSDFEAFDQYLQNMEADGGGDEKEDIQSALKTAVQNMDWDQKAVKLSFLLGDAGPHIDYDQKYTYVDASLEANQKGIKIYTIGASGLDLEGEYVYRQIAALTYSEYIFLTYGETGDSDESDLAKVSHHTQCDYDVKNLDDLIVHTVQKELAYQQVNPELAIEYIPPQSQVTHIQKRLANIWYQISKQVDYLYSIKPKALLLPFDYADSTLYEYASYLYNESLVYLVQNPSMVLLEREKLAELIDERKLLLSGLVDSVNIGDIPGIEGADLVVCGNVDRSGLNQVLFLRAFRCKDGKIVAAERIRI